MDRFQSYVRRAVGFALVITALSGTAMAHTAPELDPGSMASALTLLGGGILLLTTKRRRS